MRSFKEPIDSKRWKLTSTCHFLLELDVRGGDSHKHSHFTEVGKSKQRIKVLVQGESTTLSSHMVGWATSESMHQEDATGDLISRSPSQHDLLLRCVRSLQLPYRQGFLLRRTRRLWTFCAERLWYTCPYYICFFTSSGLLLLLLEPTLSLVRVLPLESRLSSVRVAAADLVWNPDSHIRLQLKWGP